VTVDATTAWLGFLMSPTAAKLAMEPLELDGYLTGVIVSPEMIPPRRWINRPWREDMPFDDIEEAQAAMNGIMARYYTMLNEIDRNLKQLESDGDCDYRPAFLTSAEKPSHDAMRTWVKGFWQAMALAPATWSSFAEDKRANVLVEPFVGFIDVGDGKPFEPADNIDKLLDDAAAAIPRTVIVLRMLAGMRADHPMPSSRRSKVGRNDPCPCGSGKKYKRCCAA
jgi:uncharacterized protein